MVSTKIAWTPPNVSRVSRHELSLKFKVPGSSNQEQTWSLKVNPAFGEEINVSAAPRVILGQDENASLSIQLTNQEMSTVQASDLVIRSSAGKVSNLTKLGNGGIHRPVFATNQAISTGGHDYGGRS